MKSALVNTAITIMVSRSVGEWEGWRKSHINSTESYQKMGREGETREEANLISVQYVHV
jgi:hypothetical protein